MTDETLGIVWGARAIGAVINRTERQTHYLLESGRIRAACKADPDSKRSQWCASLAGLREQFCAGGARNSEQDNAA